MKVLIETPTEELIAIKELFEKWHNLPFSWLQVSQELERRERQQIKIQFDYEGARPGDNKKPAV